jgi:hypothetical protein
VTVPVVPVDVPTVKAWLGIDPTLDTWDQMIGECLAATLAYVGRLPVSQLPDAAAADDVRQGIVMLSARTFRRRNSPAGIESIAEQVTFVASYDPDIERLLRIGRQAAPGIG